MKPVPQNPARLAPGTEVGPWRIVDRQGRGGFGAVYLVEGVEPEASGPAALKLALFPRDARFAREVELLSRLDHPCVPRLIGNGHWKAGPGTYHPYFVMEWVEGLPLYLWASMCSASSRQALRVLAGAARALEATHAVGGVHRDVKGDNLLVRRTDGQVFLVDFGSVFYEGAARLTSEVLPPGTPTYRSPESFDFEARLAETPGQSYDAQPADDVFALGVAAYRLVTGQYPPSRDPLDEESEVWRPEGTGAQPAREVNPRCCVELSVIISRMLSLRPEARGSAREVAEALEKAARKAGREADVPLFPGEASQAPSEETTQPEKGKRWSLRSLLKAAGLGAMVLGTAWLMSERDREGAMRVAPDAGTVALGDSAVTAPEVSTDAPSEETPVAMDLPSKPLKGQRRPDASGRCRRGQVAINGGCWIPTTLAEEDCGEDGYVYKGRCYVPSLEPGRTPTSSPTESRDGG